MSLRDVARQAGVSPAAPYHHFASKDALLEAIAREGFIELARVMRQARDTADDTPTARLRAIGEAYVRFALDRPAHFHVMFRRASTPETYADPDVADSFQVLLDGALEVVGVATRDRLSQRELVVLSWSVVHGAASLLLDGPLSRGIPALQIEPDDVPAMVVRTLETLLVALTAKRKR